MTEPAAKPSAWSWLGLAIHVAFVALVIGVVSWIFLEVLDTFLQALPPIVNSVISGLGVGFLFGMAYRRGKRFLAASLVALAAAVVAWPSLEFVVLVVCLWGGYYLGSRPPVRQAIERRRP